MQKLKCSKSLKNNKTGGLVGELLLVCIRKEMLRIKVITEALHY